MKNCKKNVLKSRNGITLIALVITIIVLLILAGISISMLSGDNGILQKATDAKTKSDEAQIRERVRLAYNSALTRDLTNGNGELTKTTLDEEINNEFGNSGKVEKESNYWVIYVDSNEIERIIIPESALAPTLISQGVKVGDYVNYNATNENSTFTSSELSKIVNLIDNSSDELKINGGATISDTFKSNEITKWRVISTENGIIRIVGTTPTVQKLTLQGKDGYKKSINILNKICSIYGKGKGAENANSLTLEDLKLNYDSIYGIGTEQTYTSGTFINNDNTETQASETNPITISQTAFGGGGTTMFQDETIFDIFSNAASPQIWIANHKIWANNDSVAQYGLPVGAGGGMSTYSVYMSDDTAYPMEFSLLPVVTLKSGIRGKKAQDGSWNLDI